MIRKNDNQRWRVFLGAEFWKRHMHGRPVQPGLILLGSISRSAQVGALAKTADGRFVQVNGDHVSALSQSQVSRAVRLAEEALKQQTWRDAQERRRASAPTPAVIIRRRRIVVPACVEA